MWISPRSYPWKETSLDILRGKQCSELNSEVLSLFTPVQYVPLIIIRTKHSCFIGSGPFLISTPRPAEASSLKPQRMRNLPRLPASFQTDRSDHTQWRSYQGLLGTDGLLHATSTGAVAGLHAQPYSKGQILARRHCSISSL